MKIDTRGATPVRQPPHRIPISVCQEVANQLKQMKDSRVIQSCNSPWTSLIVLVQKKDGTMHFCIDDRKLDKFSLPRIDDLLHQLGHAQYFSTLDSAARYWQVQIDKTSQEKNGLYNPARIAQASGHAFCA